MSLFQSLSTSSSKHSEQAMPESDNLRVLVVGPELSAYGLHSLLSSQMDMEVLPPISDLKQVMAFVLRMWGRKLPVHVVLMDWSGNQELQVETLRALSMHDQRCLVVTSERRPHTLEHIKQAGARGYISNSTSPGTMMTAIRHIAGADHATYFPDMPVEQPASWPGTDHTTLRTVVFHQSRLDACAQAIRWTLTEKDTHLFSNFTRETKDIAADMQCQTRQVRYDLSQRIYQFLGLLSGRFVHQRLIAFQVLLEYGILEYVPAKEAEPGIVRSF